MIYDITQPLFDCEVYPGDPAPHRTILSRIEEGGDCNLSALSLCAHNGTHVDAPLHYFSGEIGIGRIPLEKFVGPCFVVTCKGIVRGADARKILQDASRFGAKHKILLKGALIVSPEAAKEFADAGIDLLGNESQTIGSESDTDAIHRLLLGAHVVLLEGIRLTDVPDGVYLLNCAPLNLGDCDGAPCRAILMDLPGSEIC